MGRPPNLKQTIRRTTALSPEAWAAIDDFWHDQRLPSRNDAHERLIEIGAEAAKKAAREELKNV